MNDLLRREDGNEIGEAVGAWIAALGLGSPVKRSGLELVPLVSRRAGGVADLLAHQALAAGGLEVVEKDGGVVQQLLARSRSPVPILILEGGLRASLDLRSGGDIAESLDALYAYMRNRLLKASLDNDLSILEEVRRLLEELRAAWEAIGVERAAGVAGTTPALLPASLPPGLAAAAVRAYG